MGLGLLSLLLLLPAGGAALASNAAGELHTAQTTNLLPGQHARPPKASHRPAGVPFTSHHMQKLHGQCRRCVRAPGHPRTHR